MRMFFRDSKVYVRPPKTDCDFQLSQPIYSLNLVNEIYGRNLPDGFYHHYRQVYLENTNKMIDGLELVFVQLPKFVPSACIKKDMRSLWLRYLLEIEYRTRKIPSDLLEVPLIRKACDLLEESNFTEAQYYVYEKF